MRRIGVLVGIIFVIQTITFSQNEPSLGETARRIRAAKSETLPPVSPKAESTPDPKSLLNPDAATDIAAMDKYENAIAQLLQQEKFDQLELIADDARASKARFSGGVWKLYIFYRGASNPHGDGETWTELLEKLDRWKKQQPESITARVALAEAYLSYGYDARGMGSAGEVTEEGWRLLAERTKTARTILNEAAKLKAKCPEWFVAMQEAILVDGGERAEEDSILQQAIAYEPSYYYYYRRHAMYLLPKWHGEDGETERFADEASSKIGGQEGKIIYFEIASEMVHQCNCGTQIKNMSWQRIQDGHAAMEEKYGISLVKRNQFANMAVNAADPATADKTFAQIGDSWDKDTWRSRRHFDECKKWAADVVGFDKWLDGIKTAVNDNLQTPAGRDYDARLAKEFGTGLAPAMKRCVDGAPGNLDSFDIFVLLNQQGGVKQLFMMPGTPIANCLMPDIHSFVFPTPPKEEYWARISMNIKP